MKSIIGLKITMFHYNYDLDRNKSKTNNMTKWILTKVKRVDQTIPIPTKSNTISSYLKIVLFAIQRLNRSQVLIRFTRSQLFVGSRITRQ